MRKNLKLNTELKKSKIKMMIELINKSNNGEKTFLKMLKLELNEFFEKWGDYKE